MSWIRRGTAEWRDPTEADADEDHCVWCVTEMTPEVHYRHISQVAAGRGIAWHPKPRAAPPPYTPPEPVKPKIVACATAAGKLHLFDDAEVFRQWSKENGWGQAAWVDAVEWHRSNETTGPEQGRGSD